MKLIICVDDKNGLSFNNRRLSRDRLLVEDIITSCAGKRLLMNGYSARLFSDYADSIEVREDFLEAAGEDDLCFAENTDTAAYEERITGIILYRWNRHYPSDRKLTTDLSRFRLVFARDFAGSSHDIISKEEYTL